MQSRYLVGIGLLGLSAAITVHAADPAPPPNGWNGQGQAGYVTARGNTDSDSANGKFALNYVDNAWTQSLTGEALYGRSGDVTSAQRVATTFQSNYMIDPRTFAFGSAHYENDRFSGFQYQANAALGMGYKFLDTATNKLAVQLGAGYRELRPENLVLDSTGAVVTRTLGESSGNAIGTGSLNYAHVFSPSTELTEKFTADAGSDNTSLSNNLALQVKMSKALALSVGYGIIENTKPPAGLKRVDTLSTVNLVYAFGKT